MAQYGVFVNKILVLCVKLEKQMFSVDFSFEIAYKSAILNGKPHGSIEFS